MKFKAQIMDEAAVCRAIKRISCEIIEKNHGTDDICLIGIRRRGVPIAMALADNIEHNEDVSLPLGILDITLCRDDLIHKSDEPVVNATDIDFDITGRKIVLVDDVIYTGRTVRAAIDAIFSMGRPASIQLAVLIDRGHRELPFRPDYVGKNIPTSIKEIVKVNMTEYDGSCHVDIMVSE